MQQNVVITCLGSNSLFALGKRLRAPKQFICMKDESRSRFLAEQNMLNSYVFKDMAKG